MQKAQSSVFQGVRDIGMRRLTNIIFVLGLLGTLGALASLRMMDQAQETKIAQVADDVRRFELMISYQAATNEVELTGRGWPATVDPAWFGNDPPTNTLLSPDRPWVQIASADEAELLHPDIRVASDPSVAMFWYNPYQGVVRTRVPASISDQRTLALYNRLNGCNLTSIFPTERDSPAKADDANSKTVDDASPMEERTPTAPPAPKSAPKSSKQSTSRG
jgi:type II secretory pathway pseudopilin PulG